MQISYSREGEKNIFLPRVTGYHLGGRRGDVLKMKTERGVVVKRIGG